MDHKVRKHNTPIAIVIKNYLDKKGGKVSKSRNEIHWRFDALDWRYQKQILYAFLQSGKSDREWAYGKLHANWDDCFIPLLQDLWEQYHEKKLSWIVIKYFSKDYLKKNINDLSEDRNYYFLFLRLKDEKDVVFDRSRMNELDLLRVMELCGEKISEDFAKESFFKIIYKLCKGEYKYMLDPFKPLKEHIYGPSIALFFSPRVMHMLEYIEYVLKRESLIIKLKSWMAKVTNETINSTDYHIAMELPYYDEKKKFMRFVMQKFCYNNLASEYKSKWDKLDFSEFNKLDSCGVLFSNVVDLINKFDLKVVPHKSEEEILLPPLNDQLPF